MSANNFNSNNPNAIYVIELGDDDSDAAEYELEQTQETIIEQLKALGTDTRDVNAMSSDNSHSYGGWCFGMVYGVENGNYEYVTIELVQKHGYYTDANIDYVIGYLVNGEEYDDETLTEAYVYNERLQDYKEISATRVKRLRSQARALEKKVNKVLSENTTVLHKVGQFSNGEAVYERN